MQKLFFLLLIGCFAAMPLAHAQIVPQGMKYQAVARSLTGEVLANQPVTLKISLNSKGTGSAKLHYTETHTVTTNALGLFDLTVGGGKVGTGTFKNVPWSTEDIWMEVAIQDGAKNGFSTVSSSRLLAVPYAFHALTASQLSANPNARAAAGPAPSVGAPANVWATFGNTGTNPGTDRMGTMDYVDLIFVTNKTERLRITKDGDINITNSLKVGQDVEVGNDLTVKKNVFLNTTGGSTTNNGPLTVANMSATKLTGTLDVDRATNLNSTLNVVGATTLKNTLAVDGASTLKSTLDVEGATKLKNTLAVDGTTNLNSSLTVNNTAATKLTGTLVVDEAGDFKSTLNIDGATTLKNTLAVDGAVDLNSSLNVDGTINLNNTVTVGAPANLNGQVTITANLENSQDSYDNYPLRVTGNEQGMVVKLTSSKPDRGNNYITFMNGGGTATGRIEGFGGIGTQLRRVVNEIVGEGSDDASQDRNQDVPVNIPGTAADYFGTNYAFGAYQLTLSLIDNIIRLVTNAIACGAGVGVLGDCDDVFWSSVDVIVGGLQLGGYIAYNEVTDAAGVGYESGGADYAEWLQKANTKELLTYGDVVGIKGGAISKNFTEAEKFMVVSHKPAVIGGMPEAGKENQYAKVAFMGQVPVKVVGQVCKGDYILPSGNGDGMATALAPGEMKARDYGRIIGIAWAESDPKKVFNYINTAVGINSNDMSGMIEQMQGLLNTMQIALQKAVPDYKPLFYAVDQKAALAAVDYTKVPSLQQTVEKNVGARSQYATLQEAMQGAKDYAATQGLDLKQYPLLGDFFNNPTPEMAKKVQDHYMKALAKAQNLLAQQQKLSANPR
jgi:cytoskeletal protein CcmA (bactofilin family)